MTEIQPDFAVIVNFLSFGPVFGRKLTECLLDLVDEFTVEKTVLGLLPGLCHGLIACILTAHVERHFRLLLPVDCHRPVEGDSVEPGKKAALAIKL